MPEIPTQRVRPTTAGNGVATIGAGRPSVERRVAVRHLCRCKILVRFEDACGLASWEEGALRDISAGGLGLLLGDTPPIGAVLIVEPSGRKGRRVFLARAVCVTRQIGGWLVGCESARWLGEQELRSWLA